MSADIEKLAVFDDRIVQSRPKYAVEKGALSLTNSPFSAIATTASQMTFNVNVPSENVFLDRAVEWSSDCCLQFNVAIAGAITAGQPVAIYGRDFALAPFPLHCLTNTMTATINDTTATINLGDVLYETLRLADYKKNRSQRTCPTYLDTYKSYNDAFQTNNNPLGDYTLGVDSGLMPNGAWGQWYWTDPAGAKLVGSASYAVGAVNVSYVNGVPVQTAGQTSYPLFFRFTSTEKLVLSPFVFADAHEWETGLFGIQNIQLVMNMASPSVTGVSARVIRQTNGANRTISAVAYNNSVNGGTPFPSGTAVVNTQFLTPSLDIPLPPKSVVPYMEFPRYISNQTFTSGNGPNAVLSQVRSQTITLPQIPDLLIIYAKPSSYTSGGTTYSGYAPTDADFYLPIQNISVNFDNFSGLLSSQTSQQLYAMSFRNGLDMSWNEWSGTANVATASGGLTSTTGGFLVLKPSQDITLQSGQAPSLVGNFTFQFTANILNTTGGTLNGLTLYVITANSGFFESIKGSSRIIKGVLTESDIISAPLASMPTRSSLNRVVGGQSVLSRLGNVMSRVRDVIQHPITRSVAGMVKGSLPALAQHAMSAVGLGQSGGAGMSGGRRRRNLASRLM